MVLQTRLEATIPVQFPVNTGISQRKSASRSLSGDDGKYEEGKKRTALQFHSTNKDVHSRVPVTAHEVLLSSGEPLDSGIRTFMKPGSGHNFSKVRVYSPVPEIDQVQKIRHLYSGKSTCSPTWYGDTSPEIDPGGESFTGKLVVKYNDAELKDPCVRECVELHESVHVKHLTPIVKKIHDCDVAAGKDWDKIEKCNEMATHELNKITKFSECEAYRKSFTCLTLKVLDSSSPCSKKPHRDEVQRHRGYEGCEMKKYCSEAGTPEAGIPNV